MTVPNRPYIERYFPETQWDAASCITQHECSPDREGYPGSCVADEGPINCDGSSGPPAHSWGPFQIFDACWDPARNPNSPFTPEQWALRLDPNVNAWMASVIWERAGWRAWSTCEGCDVCGVRGGPIPHPRGPMDLTSPAMAAGLIANDSDIRVPTISDQGVREKLAGTPLAAYTDLILDLSRRHNIDPNWVLSYLEWESGFGAANDFSMPNNNPWDMFCYPYPGSMADCGPSEQWGASGCVVIETSEGQRCFAVYPSMEVSLEAGYRNWESYVARGWTTWRTSLSVSLCGNPDGCPGTWVNNVIQQGRDNAARWPPVPPPNCPSGTHLVGSVCVPDTEPPPTCATGWHLVGDVCVKDTEPPPPTETNILPVIAAVAALLVGAALIITAGAEGD